MRPIKDFGAQGAHQPVHIGRVLGVGGLCPIGRAGQQAAVVADHAQAGQRPGDACLDLFEADMLKKSVDQGVHLDPVPVLVAKLLIDGLAG